MKLIVHEFVCNWVLFKKKMTDAACEFAYNYTLITKKIIEASGVWICA